MGTVAEGETGRRKVRRLRSMKRLRVVLLVVGVATAVIGAGLLGAGWLQRNARWMHLAGGYLAVAAVILGGRQLMIHIDRYRKRKYRKR